jgi:uncharacterized protein (TIGR00730 family)
MKNSLLPVLAFTLLAACAEQTSEADPNEQASSSQASEDALTAGAVRLYLSPNKCKKPGEFVALGANATYAQVALDAYCGEQFVSRTAPSGWIAMFGSSRLKDGTPEYANARTFANLWTTAKTSFPIMTGGGPGIMEAGNRGAQEASGPSLGLSTYFKGPTDTLNTYVTDGYMFSDFETRERAMIRNAKAAVIYWGGVGTAWELFMALSDVQTGRLAKIPIILVGKDWTTALQPYLQYMSTKGTISPQDLDLFQIVETPQETVTAIKTALGLP